jgi:enoyl-CoA hydratase/carnithine racemase
MSQVRTLPAITDDLLSAIVQALRDVDADLVAVVLFGSAGLCA